MVLDCTYNDKPYKSALTFNSLGYAFTHIMPGPLSSYYGKSIKNQIIGMDMDSDPGYRIEYTKTTNGNDEEINITYAGRQVYKFVNKFSCN